MFRLFTAIKVFLMLFVVIATAVGLSGNILENKNDEDNYVTFWKFRLGKDFSSQDNSELTCNTMRSRMNAGAGVSVTSVCLSGLAMIVSFAELALGYKAALNSIFGILNGLGNVFLLVAWAIAISAYHRDWCGVPSAPAKNSGFKIGYGAALLVSAWCVQTVLVGIFNFCAQKSGKNAAAASDNNDDAESYDWGTSASSSSSSSASSSASSSPKSKEGGSDNEKEEKKDAKKESPKNNAENEPVAEASE